MPARPLPVVAVSLLLGGWTGAASTFFPIASISLCALLLGVLFTVTSRGCCKPSFACLLYTLFLCGMVSASLAQPRALPLALLSSAGPTRLDIIGEIAEPVRYGPSRSTAIISLRRILTEDEAVPMEGRIRLTLRGTVPRLVVGDVIRFQSRLHPPHSQLNPRGFDYDAYLHHHRIQALGTVNLGTGSEQLQVLTHVTYSVLDRADRWRGRMREAALRTLDSRGASVYLALITGETGYLSQEIRDIFMSSGTTHILSISGSHLGLIGIVTFGMIRRGILAIPSAWLLRLTLRATPTRIAAVLTMPVVAFYAILGGAEVATVRSLLMLALLLGAILLGRLHHLGAALSVAALIIVAWDPLAPLDVSFQLSFLSVLAIVLVAARVTSTPPADGLPLEPDIPSDATRGFSFQAVRVLSSMTKTARELALLAVAVSVVTVPIVAMQFHQIAWVGLIANLIIVPFVGFWVVPIGLLGCLGTLITGSTSLQGAMLIQSSLDGLLWMVQGFASVPGARWMVMSPPGSQVVIYYGCVTAVVWSHRWPRRLAGALAAALLLLWAWSPQDLPEKGSVRLTFLDVGQGDAAVLETSEGAVMLVDGGGASDVSDQGRAVIAPFLWNRGIRRLDLVIASHPQLDHIGGLGSVLREFPVGEVWTNGVDRDIPFVRRLQAVTAILHIPVRAVTSTDPPLELGSCQVHILNPHLALSNEPARRGALAGKHLNNESVVVRVVCGRTAVLFTGDIEQEAEERLVETGSLASGILKVPHHGSKASLSEQFLHAVNPEVGVVSVGHDNSYGHPSPVMLDLYRRLNIMVLRTDRQGAVTIVQTPSTRRITCEVAQRLKAIVPHRTGSWKAELENLRRLWIPDMPCNGETVRT
jgi:competence protein ComEC